MLPHSLVRLIEARFESDWASFQDYMKGLMKRADNPAFEDAYRDFERAMGRVRKNMEKRRKGGQ